MMIDRVAAGLQHLNFRHESWLFDDVDPHGGDPYVSVYVFGVPEETADEVRHSLRDDLRTHCSGGGISVWICTSSEEAELRRDQRPDARHSGRSTTLTQEILDCAVVSALDSLSEWVSVAEHSARGWTTESFEWAARSDSGSADYIATIADALVKAEGATEPLRSSKVASVARVIPAQGADSESMGVFPVTPNTSRRCAA